MSCYLFIRAVSNAKWPKGWIVDVLDGSRDLSNWQPYPDSNYVLLEISDANKLEVQHFIESWRTDFQHDVIASNAQGSRITVSVNPRVITLFGTQNGLKQEIILHLIGNYGVSVVNESPQSITIDVPIAVDLKAMKADVTDKFEQELSPRKYFITESDVDLIINAGGHVVQTKAQVLSRLKNRLID